MSSSNLTIYVFARVALTITGAGSLLLALIFFSHAILNIPPYVQLQNGAVIGYQDYKKGIPLKASLSTMIPDTSIVFDNGSGRGFMNIHKGEPRQPYLPSTKGPMKYSDTISLGFSYYDITPSKSDLPQITGCRLDEATIYVKPESLGLRLLYSLPKILTFLLIAWCCWQLSFILKSIHLGQPFSFSNYKRFLKIGFAILITQGIFLLINVLYNPKAEIRLEFDSNIENYRKPFDAIATLESPFSLGWTALGCVIIVLAQAFRKGNYLQNEEDLTI